MSKTAKVWIVIGTLFVIFGLILFTGALYVSDWNFNILSNNKYVSNTYEAKGEFDRISINALSTDVKFVATEDEVCSILCLEQEKIRHSASVQNGTLTINTTDTREWYEHIGLYSGSPKMTVYLPQKEYVSLSIESDTGDIEIPKEFSFETLNINGDTSDVKCFASVSGDLEIELSTGDINVDSLSAGEMSLITSTGDMKINSADVENNISIETDTGEVYLSGVSCTDFSAKSNTGNISLKDTLVEGNLFIDTDTGDVEFIDSDAEQLTVSTSTGDVSGTLLSDKVFITETSTGRVSVPKTISGGRCEITTSTGDIYIDVKP